MVQSLQEGLSAYFSYIPQLIGAILILIVGYIVAKLLEAVVTSTTSLVPTRTEGLDPIGFDEP